MEHREQRRPVGWQLGVCERASLERVRHLHRNNGRALRLDRSHLRHRAGHGRRRRAGRRGLLLGGLRAPGEGLRGDRAHRRHARAAARVDGHPQRRSQRNGNRSGCRRSHGVLAQTLLHYEQDSPYIAYSGTWTSSSNPSRFGGGWHYTNTAGSAAYVKFTGTELYLYGSTAPTYGQALVTVDGGAPISVDYYSANYLHKVKVFEAKGLAPGEHTVRIERAGTKNPASTGTGIGLDAMKVAGALKQATAPVSPLTRYEQTASADRMGRRVEHEHQRGALRRQLGVRERRGFLGELRLHGHTGRRHLLDCSHVRHRPRHGRWHALPGRSLLVGLPPPSEGAERGRPERRRAWRQRRVDGHQERGVEQHGHRGRRDRRCGNAELGGRRQNTRRAPQRGATLRPWIRDACGSGAGGTRLPSRQ